MDWVNSIEPKAGIPARDWVSLGLATASALTVLYAITSLFLPFGWDHGIIASVSSSYVDGGLPYVNSWDMKGPVAYLPFSFAELLFGRTMWGARLMDLAFWAVAGFVMYKGVREVTNTAIGLWAALTTYMWLASSGWFFTAAPESWVTASCIVALIPLLRPATSSALRTCLLSGFLIACAGLVKPFYFLFGLVPLLNLALSSELALRQRMGLAAALALGAFIPVATIGGYFALRGGLQQLIEVHLLYPMSTYVDAEQGWRAVVAGVAAFLFKTPIIGTLPLALVAIWNWKARPRTVAALLTWLLLAFVCVAIQKKYFVYHWFPAYPPLFMLGALGLFDALNCRKIGKHGPLVVFALAAVILAASIARPVRDIVKLGYYAGYKKSWDAYYGTYGFRLYNSRDEIDAARYIKAHTGPGDGVYIWGSDATVSYLADRPDPVRFTFAMPLSMPGQYREAYRQQAMRQLTANPPTYFIVGIDWQGLASGLQSLDDFPAMSAFLARNYHLEKRIGVISLYRLQNQPDAAPPAGGD